jgi:alkylhydroperoxidase/carboxymuconolactone decarboxylase family protein YurZ
MVDLPSSPLANVDPEFEKMALETGAFTYQLTGTTVREKLLQNLANDVCRLQMGLAFRLHVTAANMHRIPYGDLLALLRFVAPYAGYPAAADALARLAEIANDIGMDMKTEPLIPTSVSDQVASWNVGSHDTWVNGFLESRLGRAWSEERLSRRERVIVALTTDVSQDCPADSFALHVKLGVEAGMTEDELRDVIRFCAEMSITKAIAASRRLESLLTER